MKNLYLISFLVLFVSELSAQINKSEYVVNGVHTIQIEPKDSSVANTNLYEYGKPIYSCDCNFKNLLNNWNVQYITNSHETELISYRFVRVIENSTQLNYWKNVLTGDKQLGGNIGSNISIKENGYDKSRIINHRFFYTWTVNMDRELEKGSFDESAYLIPSMFLDNVQVGDSVYAINAKLRVNTYEMYGNYQIYVICSSKNKRVVWDNVFGNAVIPLSEIKLYD
ncbi:hypothetical protein D0T53_09190 [Dysgonomonas sp. 216]|uniref:hypothetical protein n=1 Tax=Dysgonomonas sp. 216 TaxID=2302934 RepID=UPI0013D390FB|nr:hypothetical protein [Dysgonomonas sp. 216]NDW19086.1 hypothetical protein [Dysgonomonas sp. 216]